MPRAPVSSRQPDHLFRLPAFAAVGFFGFLTEAVVLTSLVRHAGFGLYVGRAISFIIAVSLTWLLNRTWTFRDRASGARKAEYLRYACVQSFGALLNLMVYVLIVEVTGPAIHPVVPLAGGAAVALGFNFLGARFIVFRAAGARSWRAGD